MIIREIFTYRVLDATTNSLVDRPTNYTPILPPLLSWTIQIGERKLVLIEPTSGTLGSPEPNAFMVLVPPNFNSGQLFAVQLLDTDWESEGFAVGDSVDMAMGPVSANSVFLRAIIRGINGQIATFRVDAPYIVQTGFNPQQPFPLIVFLRADPIIGETALLRSNDSGFISPLNGQRFATAGHANHIQVSIGALLPNNNLRYNLRFYDASQEQIIDSIMPDARVMRERLFTISGTQFYAYRSSLDPTANTPTNAYPTRGKIVFLGRALNLLRDFEFEAECILLHPNRLGETTSFVPSGTLSISGGVATISAPSVPSPIKTFVCLLGPDSHHSLPINNSTDLTSPTVPPNIPPPRSGSDYVGVVVGAVNGEWVAVMTNRVRSTEPIYNLNIIAEGTKIARYDYIVLETTETSARQRGIYTIVILGQINGDFVQLATFNLNINQAVSTPKPDYPNATEALGNLYPLEYGSTQAYSLRVANWDFSIYNNDPIRGNKILFYVPIPSSLTPPQLPSFTQPISGYLLDLIPFLDSPLTIKAQVICPDGTVLESAPKIINREFRVDTQLAQITETPNEIRIELNRYILPNNNIAEIYGRVALFRSPIEYTPINQAIFYAQEDYTAQNVLRQYDEYDNRVRIVRPQLSGYTYEAVIAKSGLPAGQYIVHVRTEFDWPAQSENKYESFFYLFTIGPERPQIGPPIISEKCKVNIPALIKESWQYIALGKNQWDVKGGNIESCNLLGYCGCFEIIEQIPENWIDIIGYFRGSVWGLPVPNGAIHKGRFIGRIIRQDDEYTTEDFVSSLFRQEDIVRAYASRYQVEIFAQTHCDLTNIDILKFAEYWEVVNRSNKMLPSVIGPLRPMEVSISDSGEHAKVVITLKGLLWRDEYRRQG